MKKHDLLEWSAAVLESKDKHFDGFDEPLINDKTGLQLLEGSCELILKLQKHFKDTCVEPHVQYVFIHFPLEYDGKTLPKWKESNWNKLGKAFIPPRLFYSESRYGYFDHQVEFYALGLELPFKKKYPIDCFYKVQSRFYESDLTEFYPDLCLVSQEPLGPKRK